jgi:hypothetical protein
MVTTLALDMVVNARSSKIENLSKLFLYRYVDDPDNLTGSHTLT